MSSENIEANELNQNAIDGNENSHSISEEELLELEDLWKCVLDNLSFGDLNAAALCAEDLILHIDGYFEEGICVGPSVISNSEDPATKFTYDALNRAMVRSACKLLIALRGAE